MKKSLWMLGLAVAAMTSCTNDEVLEQNQSTQKAIGFEGFVNKTTRGISETTNSGLEKFYVDGYYMLSDENVSVFEDEAVTKTTEDDGTVIWDYATDHYKYWTDNVYYFAGYAQSNNDDDPLDINFAPGTEDDADKHFFSFTHEMSYINEANKLDYSGQDIVADLVSIQGSTSANPGDVSFTFRHLFSKVKFTVYNTDPKFTMNITNLTINGVKYKGTFTSQYKDSWAPQTSDWNLINETYASFIPVVEQNDMHAWTSNDINEAASQASNELLVMPQDLANVTFTIEAEFYSGEDLVYTKTFNNQSIIIGDNNKWEPNTYYNYTIKLPSAASRIEFGSQTVQGWGDPVDIELNTTQS